MITLIFTVVLISNCEIEIASRSTCFTAFALPSEQFDVLLAVL